MFYLFHGLMRKILVTGCNGTIGTELCLRLLKEGHEVLGIDMRDNKWEPAVAKITQIKDLTKKEEVNSLPIDIDVVIHLAANARVYDLVIEPDKALANVTTTYNILEYVRKTTGKRILFASSRETYGNQEKEILKETDADFNLCESPYAASKFAGEAFVQGYRRAYGVKGVIVRFSNVYGKYDESNRFVPLMIRKMKAGEDVEIFGEEKCLDFTYITDAIDGVMLMIKKFDQIDGEVINLGYGAGAKLTAVAEMIKKELSANSNIAIKDNRPGEVIRYVADITKAKTLLGYHPQVSIEEGIKKSIEWANSQ